MKQIQDNTIDTILNTRRNFIGFELDPDYYRAATERLETHKSQIALEEVLEEGPTQLELGGLTT